MKHAVFDWPEQVEPIELFGYLRRRKDDVLLDSARQGPHGRFSYIGLDPHTVVKAKKDHVFVDGSMSIGNPLDILKDVLVNNTRADNQNRPSGFPMFYSGTIGYLGYDLKNSIEPKLSTTAVDDTDFWDMYMVLPSTVIAFDHQERLAYVSVADWNKIDLDRIENILKDGSPETDRETGSGSKKKSRIRTNLSFQEYKRLFRRARDYIHSGDAYQIKISLRHEFGVQEDPLAIYRRLREINPSPYAAFLDLDGICLAGCSPEELFRLEGGIAETRPIGGTYPRGGDETEDADLASSFYSDEKEVAEHSMLIDLERNDIGRVCRVGSVDVVKPMELEKYSHLMHIVTTIRGELADDKDAFDLIRSMFPGGTVTGCPKIRAMEIIDELEPVARGPYTGSIGFVTPAGEAQFNIIIRTLAINKGNGRGFVQVGGGIVADSNPEYEYAENLRKGAALVEAIAGTTKG